MVESIDQVLQRCFSFAKRLGHVQCLLDWPGCGHWDLPGDESLASVGVVAAQAWVVLAIIVVHPKEIESPKMVAVERIMDEVLLLRIDSLRWVPEEHDALLRVFLLVAVADDEVRAARVYAMRSIEVFSLARAAPRHPCYSAVGRSAVTVSMFYSLPFTFEGEMRAF